MPIQFQVWERRDSADRIGLGNAALDLCRPSRAIEGIRSSRFYWNGADAVVFLTDGETAALNDLGDSAKVPADQARALFHAIRSGQGHTQHAPSRAASR